MPNLALLALEASDGTVVLTSITLVFAMLIALCLIITLEGKLFDLKNKKPADPKPQAPAAPAAGEQICAPMPGNILAVNVTAGQTVKKGDVLMVLEAMKMENEIMCPRDGVVASVNTSKGASVESGTLLCVLQ